MPFDTVVMQGREMSHNAFSYCPNERERNVTKCHLILW